MKIIASLLLALAGCVAAENLRPSGDRRLSSSGSSSGSKSSKSSNSEDDTPAFPPNPYNPYDFLPPAPEFTLTSAEIVDGGELPLAQASAILGVPGGGDQAPSLSWSGFPPETRSFVVTMYDPDAPNVSGVWHWAAYGIPASVTSLPLGGALPAGAIPVPNEIGLPGYLGAGAPDGRTHRYIFCVSALGVTADQLPGLDPATVRAPILNFRMYNVGVIGRAFLTATFTRDEM